MLAMATSKHEERLLRSTSSLHSALLRFPLAMTPDEVVVLQGIGRDWVHGFIAIVHHTFWMTVYAALVLKASFLLLRKDRRTLRTYIFFSLAIFTMFAIALVLLALDFTTFILEGKITLMQLQPGDAVGDRLDVANKRIFKIISALDALYAYMSLLGDAIIIHRVRAVGQYFHRYVFLIPCALLLGSTVATLMLTYCVAVAGDEIVLGSFEKPAFCHNVQQVTYIMPMATTAVTTVMIGHAAWRHRNVVAPVYSDGSAGGTGKRRRSQAERLLMLLVESGFFYFLFFLIQVIGDITQVEALINSSTTLTILMMMFDYSSSTFVGIYPTVIVLLAHSRHGVIDDGTAVSRTRASKHVGEISTIRLGGPRMPVDATGSAATDTTFPVDMLGDNTHELDDRSWRKRDKQRPMETTEQ
ncbi:hypothetical protein MIND_01277800 [Mycena indigotica]|uniref:Uncharacterized protein n=1 Tax=Mycena indigotica TaxID=2126181 RepID=A0A8H6VV77_9AGAR|nr:uncharacterized protein MIND_01277800 [Mycena indigotica]KAF7291333.1 hypothetical protein MIND_01277800 [Mycena indigotica]